MIVKFIPVHKIKDDEIEVQIKLRLRLIETEGAVYMGWHRRKQYEQEAQYLSECLYAAEAAALKGATP